MPKEVTTFNPEEVTVLWGGLVIVGFADETAIEVTFNEDHVSPKTGVKGDTMYTINGNRSGNVKLVLFDTSSSLQMFRDDAVGYAEKPIMIRNAGSDGAYLAGGDRCRVLRAPGVSVGKEGGTKEINIYVPELDIQGA